MAECHGTEIIPLLFSEYSEPQYLVLMVSIYKSSLWPVNGKTLLNGGTDPTPVEISEHLLLHSMTGRIKKLLT